MEALNATGTTHIIAISGYNIAIILTLIGNTFSHYVSKKTKFIISTALIISFVLICGAPASVVRAAIMGLIVVWARDRGRANGPISVLIFAALIMVIVNPKILVFDVGFQLSFLATLGIMIFADAFEDALKWVPELFGIRESLVLTLTAQVGVVPLLFLNFGSISLITFVANIIVLPLIPIIMATGFVAVVTSFVFFHAGFIASYVSRFMLDFEMKSIYLLAQADMFTIEIGKTRGWMLILYCVVFIMIGLIIHRKKDACKK